MLIFDFSTLTLVEKSVIMTTVYDTAHKRLHHWARSTILRCTGTGYRYLARHYQVRFVVCGVRSLSSPLTGAFVCGQCCEPKTNNGSVGLSAFHRKFGRFRSFFFQSHRKNRDNQENNEIIGRFFFRK